MQVSLTIQTLAFWTQNLNRFRRHGSPHSPDVVSEPLLSELGNCRDSDSVRYLNMILFSWGNGICLNKCSLVHPALVSPTPNIFYFEDFGANRKVERIFWPLWKVIFCFICLFLFLFFCNKLCFPGVGAIYIRRRPRVRVEALQSGGGQERGMRSGTVPTPLVVGLGAACEVAQQEMEVWGKQFPPTNSYPVLGLLFSSFLAWHGHCQFPRNLSLNLFFVRISHLPIRVTSSGFWIIVLMLVWTALKIDELQSLGEVDVELVG